MKASPQQIRALRDVAKDLGPLRDEVVLFGGMVTGFLITAPAAPIARSTDDIDLIVEVTSTLKYQTELRDRLLDLGFRESVEDDAVCRWAWANGSWISCRPDPGCWVSRTRSIPTRWRRHVAAISAPFTRALQADPSKAA